LSPTPRSPKGETRAPEDLQIAGGGASGDKVSEIYDRLGSIDSSVRFLEAAADDTRKDIKALSDRVVSAEAMFRTLKWVAGIAGAACVLLWTFIAGLVTLGVKHYLGW
jgi:hypothetical protein